jgi:hypothetical protein
LPISSDGREFNYRPVALQLWFLLLVLIADVLGFGLLVTVLCTPSFSLINVWGYFVAQIFPIVFGTITSAQIDAIVLSFSRITPFILSADPTTEGKGVTADKTILGSYFPAPSFRVALRTGNWLLLYSLLIKFFSFIILGFKASLLTTSNDYSMASGDFTSAIILVTFYALATIHTLLVMSYLSRKKTGLLWDPVSMADYLVLFQNKANIRLLENFAGACIATRASMEEKLSKLILRLGYWKSGDNVWHGFGMLNIPMQDKQEVDEVDSAGK